MPWLFTIYMASSTSGKWWAKLRTGIVFNICTIQFLLPKTAAKALNWYKKLRFHNRTRIHVCNIPSFVPQNFPLERPKTSCFIYSFSSRIFRKHFCQSLHGKQPIFPYHTHTPYVGWVCCWFSPLLREVFLQVLRFPLPSKNQRSQIPIRSETHRRFIEFLRTPKSSVGWLFTVPYFSLWSSRYSESYR